MNAKMHISSLLAFCVAFPVMVAGEEIYRWVDDNGVVHFSDVPNGNADRSSESIQLEPPQTFSSPPTEPGVGRAAAAARTDTDANRSYQALLIVSPAEEDTIWNTGGLITVTVSPQPALQDGHSVRMYYNGELIQSASPMNTSAQISGVVRGTHRISAEILNQMGEVLIAAKPVTFYYKQTTVRLDGSRPVQQGAPNMAEQTAALASRRRASNR